MASINFHSKNGGGDDSSRSPVRSRGVSNASPWSKIARGDSGDFPAPVVSVAAPAASPSVQEQIIDRSSDLCQSKAVPETAISPDDSGIECRSEGSDSGGGGSNVVKKAVWSKPSNGVVEVVAPVMGADSWPALGESTKASPKSSSSELLQALSDGSLLPALQVTGNSSPSLHRLASANNMNPNSIMNPNSTPNHVPTGQRSMKRGGGYVSSNGGVSQPPPTGHGSIVEPPPNTAGKLGSIAMESQRGSFGSQSNSGNDHHNQRNSYRRGNGGQYPRGDGGYHHNYGGKLDQGRGNQEWNHHRSFNNRENNMQPQRGGFRRGYARPSVHTSTPFIPPPMPMPVRPFGNSVMYPDVASTMIYVQGPPPPESLRSMPLVARMPAPVYFTVPDPYLHDNIVNQIDYYFSNENLVKDTYLRRNMDEQGWVPISLIAGFKKVLNLTDNIQLILDVMRTSIVVEVQGDKIRRRNDWMRWLMPPTTQLQQSGAEKNAHITNQQTGFERTTVA